MQQYNKNRVERLYQNIEISRQHLYIEYKYNISSDDHCFIWYQLLFCFGKCKITRYGCFFLKLERLIVISASVSRTLFRRLRLQFVVKFYLVFSPSRCPCLGNVVRNGEPNRNSICTRSENKNNA